MKGTSYYLLSVVLAICLSSCHPLTRLIYGVRSPQLVEASIISKYMKKLNMENEIVLIPKDIDSYFKILKIVNGVPNFLVFNQNGIALKDTVTGNCNAPVFEQTQNVCLLQTLQNASVSNLNDFLAMLKPLSPEDSLKFEKAKQIDVNFTSFVTSARYTGYLNKDHVKPWVDNLKSITDCKVKAYIINLDLVEGVWTKEIIEKIEYK